jgi:Caspase domain
MSRALVAIGVSHAPPLDMLDGAIEDANDLADWARSVGYEHVYALTDEGGVPVKARKVYEVCKKLLKIKDLEQLVIFFSGHGFVPAVGCEYWLLSDWNDDANEAINASTTCFMAKGLEKPQISFIADACRQTFQEALGTTGMVILPKPKVRAGNSQVDEFYATPLGAVAQQYQPAQRRASYGVFSKEVVKALNGAAVIVRDSKRLVTSRSLQDYLRNAVPRACAEIHGAAIQDPDTRADWREPKDFYVEFAGRHRGGTIERERRSEFKPMPPAVKEAAEARNSSIDANSKRYQAAEGRQSYETATGVTVIGATVEAVVASYGRAEPFEEDDTWQIRVSDSRQDEIPREPSHLLIRILNPQGERFWISVPVFPKLVATALIDNNGFSSLNYRIAKRFRPQELEPASREVEATLADAAAMFQYGVMPSVERLREIILVMRYNKLDNPALAIIAGHICYRLGDLGQIADMERYEIGRGRYTPYDFLLLTGRDKPAKGRKVVGAFPLMSQGWGLLAAAEFKVDPRLQRVFAGLAPSLWTMVTPQAGEVLAEVISGALAVPPPSAGRRRRRLAPPRRKKARA